MSGSANKIVLVSDVHMGTNQAVSWYQPAVLDRPSRTP